MLTIIFNMMDTLFLLVSFAIVVLILHNRTSVGIARRLSTIQPANEIIVLNAGEIVQRGNHHDLIATGGIFKKLFEMHSFT